MKKSAKAAAELLKQFRIQKAPVPVELIAKGLGAKLQFEPFDGNDDVSAMLFRDGANTVIGVNAAHAHTRQRFSIAHECGHLKLHKGQLYVDARVNFRNAVSSKAIDPEEIEANAFAAELLMPEEFILVEIEKVVGKRKTHDAEIVTAELSKIFEVSRQAMEIRLTNLGLIVDGE